MVTPRISWSDVPPEVRDAVVDRTGPVRETGVVSAGLNSEIAVFLDTAAGPVFVKGRPTGRAEQRREAAIAPHVVGVAPRLRWRIEVSGWDLLGFERLSGRHADYAPGSDDLDAVVDVIGRLGTIRCPELPDVKRAEQRWSSYLEDASVLAGNTLLHTDFNPLNVLVDGGRGWLIDWAWPTRGAAFIDPSCWVVRLIAAGHSPESAEAWANRCPAFAAAADDAVTVFARACCRVWDEIEQHESVPWKQDMAKAARQWLEYRTG